MILYLSCTKRAKLVQFWFFTAFSSTPAKRYGSRENAGEVATTFNPTCVLDENISWSRQQDVKIKNVVDEPLTKKYKYMFQKIIDKTQGSFVLGFLLLEIYKIT